MLSGPGCYRTFLGAVCDSARHNATLAEPLFGLAQRCIGVNATCAALSQPGSLLTPTLQARATNGTTAGSTATDAANSTVPALPAPDPYKLLPQESPAASDTLLATPDEIAAVAARGSG